jgi:D-sedoheptulose 7-phosphate isomerase
VTGAFAAALRDLAATALRVAEELGPDLDQACEMVRDTVRRGGTLFFCGNGGSAADAQHLAAELVGRFDRERRPLAATALSVDPSVLTCIANDYEFAELFARQVRALAAPGDVVIGFTTSGRSANVVRGLEAARGRGATTIVFAGGDGAPAADHADHALVVPSRATARVQEVHLLLLHLLVEQVDRWAAEDGA